MRRPKRAPSSATWAAQTSEARADLYASDEAGPVCAALDAVLDDASRRAVVQAALRAAHRAGAEREADLVTSVDVLRAQVARMTRRMIAAGLDPYARGDDR